ATDVDEVTEVRQPQRQHRNKALPAGEHLRFVTEFGQQTRGLLDGARGVIFERRRLHDASSSVASKAWVSCGKTRISVTRPAATESNSTTSTVAERPVATAVQVWLVTCNTTSPHPKTRASSMRRVQCSANARPIAAMPS